MKKYLDLIIYSFEFLKKHWIIYIIDALFVLYTFIRTLTQVTFGLEILVALLNLGWLGTKFEFIKLGLSGKKLPFNKLFNYIWKYIKKLLPMAIVFMIVILILFGTIFYLYFKWYFSIIPLSSNSLLRSQQLKEMFTSLTTISENKNFMMHYGWMFIAFDIINAVFSTLLTFTFINLVTSSGGVISSFKKAFSFIGKNMQFFSLILLVGGIVLFLNTEITTFLKVHSIINLSTQVLFPGLVILFVNLIIEIACFVYFGDKNHHFAKD